MTKNFKNIMAGVLALGVFLAPCANSLASEDKNDESLFEILASDIDYSEDEKASDTKDIEAFDILEDSEPRARLSLYEKVELARHIDDVNVADFIRLINTRAADESDLAKGLSSLEKIIEESGEKLALDLDIEAMKKDVEDFYTKGKLFYNDLLDKKDLDNLHLQYEAVINSRAYENSEDKSVYNGVLNKTYDLIVGLDQKSELSDDDRARIERAYHELLALEDEKSEPIKETKTLKNKNYLSNAGNEAENEINTESGFYKSEKTRSAYEGLSADERKTLDAINTNGDDKIDEAELKADGQYSLENMPEDFWLRPFIEKKTESTTSETTTESDGQNKETTTTVTTKTVEEKDKKTEDNPISGTPETVTISKSENQTSDDKKDAPTNTYASSNVKTGIKGLGIVVVILIIAVLGFVLTKNKDKK